MKRTTMIRRPDHLRDIQAARASAAARAAAQPKRRRKPARRARTEPVRPVAAPPIEPRGLDALAVLGERMHLEPKVTRRRRELDDLAAVMTGVPRGRR